MAADSTQVCVKIQTFMIRIITLAVAPAMSRILNELVRGDNPTSKNWLQTASHSVKK